MSLDFEHFTKWTWDMHVLKGGLKRFWKAAKTGRFAKQIPSTLTLSNHRKMYGMLVSWYTPVKNYHRYPKWRHDFEAIFIHFPHFSTHHCLHPLHSLNFGGPPSALWPLWISRTPSVLGRRKRARRNSCSSSWFDIPPWSRCHDASMGQLYVYLHVP